MISLVHSCPLRVRCLDHCSTLLPHFCIHLLAEIIDSTEWLR